MKRALLVVLLTLFLTNMLVSNIPKARAVTWVEVTRRSGVAFPHLEKFNMTFEINYVNWRVKYSYVAVGWDFESLLIIKKNGELFIYSSGYISRSGVRNVYNETGNFTLEVYCLNMYEYTIIVEQDVDSAYARTIYIRADGSIDPPTAPISTLDNVTYTFIDNIYDWTIVVEKNSIIIDGNGYTLQGTKRVGSIGIDLSERINVTVRNMQITNFTDGIKSYFSSNISISGNNIMNNSQGISIFKSLAIHITENNIKNNSNGIIIIKCSNTIIRENNIINNSQVGIISISSSNIIYHNNFIGNHRQLNSYDSVNVLDDGYPSGGNYWSDYVGLDIKSGPDQNLPGSDGISDTPCVIDENNVDHYPLMYPYGTPSPLTYILTIVATAGGTTGPTPASYSYVANSTVQVTAIPGIGFSFEYWLLDGEVRNENPITIFINANHTLIAHFAPLQTGAHPASLWTDPIFLCFLTAIVIVIILAIFLVHRKKNRPDR